MIKHIFRTKKAMIAFALSLVVTVAAGATYAWFTATATTEASNAETGRLQIGAEFYVDAKTYLYEPSLSIKKTAKFSNLGSLPSATMVDVNADVLIKSDGYGIPLEEWQYYHKPADDGNLKLTLDETKLGYYTVNKNTYISWWKVNDQPGKYICFAEGDVSSDIACKVLLDGPGMGNDYQGAMISLTGVCTATQVNGDAMLATFGYDYDDITEIDQPMAIPAGAGLGRSIMTSPRERIEELLARNADTEFEAE